MALNAVQLAALDLLIEMKRSGPTPAFFIHAEVDVQNAGDVAVAAGAVAVVTAAVAFLPPPGGGTVPVPTPTGGPIEGWTLDQLIAVRQAAVSASTGNNP